MGGRTASVAGVTVLCGLLLAPPARADLFDTPNAQGAMAGRTVVVSPGHGMRTTSGGWQFQRGTTPTSWSTSRRIREDIHTNEIVILWLQRYLSNAGAVVFSCRERGFQRNEVIVDNRDPGYRETGTWGPGSGESTSHPDFYGTGYRYAYGAQAETAVASFEATLPEAGAYPVYVWYTPSANRSATALYRVRHAGGVTEVRVDQSRYQAFWFYLGTFPFTATQPAVVELSNAGTDAKKVVVADGVRFGGGVGRSGRPRWQEAAREFLPYAGYPGPSSNDVTIRPKFANWLAGNPERSGTFRQDFRFVSVHSNAFRGASRGTLTISFSNGRTPSWSGYGTGPAHYVSGLQAASDAFRDLVQSSLTDQLVAAYGSWRARGVKILNLGELREARAMPGMLTELAFHDNPDDATYLRDERFRHLVARAIYKAVARSFDPNAVVVPLPPREVVCENAGGGMIRVSWLPEVDPLDPTASPTAYKVYVGSDGFGFDDGQTVQGTSARLGPYAVGDTVYVRVAGLNAGGESLPTKVFGARVAGSGAAAVLIVDGFTRSFHHSHDNVYERYPKNSIVRHGVAFAQGTGLGFDSAGQDAIVSGRADVGTYAMVDWFTGQNSTQDETLSDREQAIVAGYLQSGGALLLSGAELGWDLVDKGSASDKAFYRDWLRATYVKDDAGTYDVQSVGAGGLASVGPLTLDDGTRGSYRVRFPDVLSPGSQAVTTLEYGNGAGGAALEVQDAFRLVYLGFPLEGIADDGERATLVTRATDMLLAGLGGSAGGGVTTGPTTPAAGASSGGGSGGGGGGCSLAPAGSPESLAPLLLLLAACLLAVRRRAGTAARRRRS